MYTPPTTPLQLLKNLAQAFLEDFVLNDAFFTEGAVTALTGATEIETRVDGPDVSFILGVGGLVDNVSVGSSSLCGIQCKLVRKMRFNGRMVYTSFLTVRERQTTLRYEKLRKIFNCDFVEFAQRLIAPPLRTRNLPKLTNPKGSKEFYSIIKSVSNIQTIKISLFGDASLRSCFLMKEIL